MPTHYEVLGIAATASREQVQAAYHRAAGGQGEALVFRLPEEVEEAYDTLSDPARRTAYDSSLPPSAAKAAAPASARRPVAPVRGAAFAAVAEGNSDPDDEPGIHYDPRLDLPNYRFPTLDLLNDAGPARSLVSQEELDASKDHIVETLGYYKIGIASINAIVGPTVTWYEIVPEAGVRISKIKRLENDLTSSLALPGLRLVVPIPGQNAIALEVPRAVREPVCIRSVLSAEKFARTGMALPVAFGRTVTNEVFVADLARMPHLLIAGATGQGKSMALNAILASLLYKCHPAQLKLVLLDPKRLELTLFQPVEQHFLAKLAGAKPAIVTDTPQAVHTLNSLCVELDSRYDLLKAASCRTLTDYNGKFGTCQLDPRHGHRYLPFLVLAIDELANLLAAIGKEVEAPLIRLAQLGHTVGIHLIVATQRPTPPIMTAALKAYFPCRIACQVVSKADSRSILDTDGAEQLTGAGDLLFMAGADLVRMQGAFISTPEIERLCTYIGGQVGYLGAYLLPEVAGADTDDIESSPEVDAFLERDSMFVEAARCIVLHQQGSTSLIQRKLKLGYNRSGRLMDQLHHAGIVGPFEGSKAREVLIADEYQLELLLSALPAAGFASPASPPLAAGAQEAASPPPQMPAHRPVKAVALPPPPISVLPPRAMSNMAAPITASVAAPVPAAPTTQPSNKPTRALGFLKWLVLLGLLAWGGSRALNWLRPFASASPAQVVLFEGLVISKNGLSMRVEPSKKAAVTGTIPWYVPVSVLRDNGPLEPSLHNYPATPWYLVSYAGKTGWVLGEFVQRR